MSKFAKVGGKRGRNVPRIKCKHTKRKAYIIQHKINTRQHNYNSSKTHIDKPSN